MEVLTRRTIVCPLGGDLADKGAKLGPRTVKNDEAGASEVTRLIEGGRIPRVVLSAGNAKLHGKSNNYPQQPDDVSMALMMKDHLISLGVSPRLIRIPRETWGTKAELKTVQMEVEAAEKSGEIVEEVVLIATWWHAYRTRRNAETILRRPVRVIKTEDDASDRDLIEEGIKIVAEEIRTRVPFVGTLLRRIRGRD